MSAAASSLREARATDLDAILALQRRYYAEDGYPFATAEARQVLARFLADPALGRIWLIDDAAGTAGYVALTFGYSFEFRGRDAFVDEIYLLPERRGRGHGGRALARVKDAARALGVRALHLEVERNKPGAKALYRRVGFVDHERYLMTLELHDRRHGRRLHREIPGRSGHRVTGWGRRMRGSQVRSADASAVTEVGLRCRSPIAASPRRSAPSGSYSEAAARRCSPRSSPRSGSGSSVSRSPSA